jgi:NitT/TauT family transport system permease protein
VDIVEPGVTSDTRRSLSGPAALAGRLRRRSTAGRWLWLTLPPFLVFLLFLGAWYLVSYRLLSADRRFLLPPPHEVVRVAFLDRANLGELLRALGLSTTVAMVGLAIAIGIGVVTAILMSQAPWVERSIYPYAVVLQTIPILALVPLIGFWFEFGFNSRIIVCVLISLFPIINNTLFGLRSVDSEQRDLFLLHNRSRLVRLWKLELPAALPAMLAGFRISAGLSVIGAIVGDFFFKQGDPGIGILIDLYRSRLQSEQLFGAVILSSLLGIVVFWFFGILARVGTSWHESARDSGTEKSGR